MNLNANFSPRGRIEAWAFTVFLFFGLITFAIFEFSYIGRFYPNVTIGEVSIGGLRYDDVLRGLQNLNQELTEKGLKITVQSVKKEGTLLIPMSAQGLTPDSVVEYFTLDNWQARLLEAYAYGRTGSVLSRFWDHLKSLLIAHRYTLPADIQESAVNSLLDRELSQILDQPKPAHFFNTSKGIQITGEQNGEQVDRDELLSKLRFAFQNISAEPIVIRAFAVAHPITAEKLKPFLEQAKNVRKNSSIQFTYNGDRWNVSGATLITWLIPKGNGPKIRLGIDPEALKKFLDTKISPLIENPPQNSRFAMNGDKLVEISPGKSGDSINFSEIEARIDQLISAAQGIAIVPVPIIVEPPKITGETIKEYKIKELVAMAKTNMTGSSPDRRHNIQNGIAKLNGVLIAPGEEFSAVRAIGTTTEENGFVKEYVIKEDRSVKELGGGLCQVSTTLFRLALNAGLPITERTNHRYVVGYYGPGLDATIYGPYPDLKFINDTGHYLLIQGRVEKDDVIFEFYGQKDKRSAFISEPVLSDEKPAPETKYIVSPDLPFGTQQCSETPRKGVTAEVTYKVAYPSGETKEQVFKSVYQPWPRICLLGTNHQQQLTTAH